MSDSSSSATVAPVKVLYIAGWSRSGSTLLDITLGSVPGLTSTGELRHLWIRGLVQERLCGCGVPVPKCDHWRRVLDRIGGYPHSEGMLDPEAVIADQRAVGRTRHTRRLLSGADDPAVRRLQDLHRRLYSSILEETGASVVVDSSKMPADAALLATAEGIDLHLVHLVRDPRAVAWSWQRPKMMTDIVPPRPIAPHTPLRSTLQWLGWNRLIERVAQHAASVSFVRYEDLVARPTEVLGDLVRAVGLPRESVDGLVEGDRFRIEGSHTVAGNPARFNTGSVTVTLDDDWYRDQPGAERWTATTVALPRLRRYGYPLVAGRGGGR